MDNNVHFRTSSSSATPPDPVSFPLDAMRDNPPFPFTRLPHGRSSAYPQSPPASPPPNFTIDLRLCGHSNNNLCLSRPEIDAIVNKCQPAPESIVFFPSAHAIATISYCQWTHARDAVQCLWKSRLEGDHFLSPSLHSLLLLPSDEEELDGILKTLFLGKIDEFLEGEKLRIWQKKLDRVLDEIARVNRKRRSKFRTLISVDEEKALLRERELITKRIREFKSALNCIRAHLEETSVENQDGLVPVFKFESKDFDWSRIHQLLLRECKRLEDGLPIYACRRDILAKIYVGQVIVLIGETGSGKSTQLAQFIADSGLFNDAIVCTQPRKIAAATLAERVRDESSGCYEDNSIIFRPGFSSSQSLSSSKVVYMTDHCLLQHYMHDENLNGVSCIIIDEAHERSLNTDLLLAMIRDLLGHRPYLRLVIMSATADAKQLSDYYFGCDIMHVTGRNFPVDIKYVNSASGNGSPGTIPQYVSEAVRVAKDVHNREKVCSTDRKGTILVFLTSQMEVEWACENFVAPSAVALPLHGKLSHEEQYRIFQEFPEERKVIFSTNLAETSLTIPGVKYVIDSGKVKECFFDPKTGMNVLRVCSISKSSASQRAGRAGRTEPGVCFRLYDISDFEKMPDCQEPEIRRVHLGVAVLKILALGINNVQDFKFVDAPSDQSIDMAMRNLVQLGAIALKKDVYELTEAGRYLVKLGIEPRLGKLIYSCYNHHYGREGVVLAAVMANASSIFCRAGTPVDKVKSDSLKVRFCHHSGDLFTLLSVYKEWESMHWDRRNKWCWENSINAKSMRRCNETVQELQDCLRRELGVDIPSSWVWNPLKTTVVDSQLQKIILSCLSENVAMFSGHDKLGYKVALTGKHVQLHPSSSLLVFSQKPSWVVFGEILSISHPYLVCVTAFDFESLSALSPPPLFDPLHLESQRLQFRVITGYGKIHLRKFCGKKNYNLEQLEKRFQEKFSDERIRILMDIDLNEVSLAAPAEAIKEVFTVVNDLLECEKKWMQNECELMCLYKGPASSVPMALLGAGAEIQHLELQRRDLSVNVFHQNAHAIDDKELLTFIEKTACGSICAVKKFFRQDNDDKEKWGRVTFMTPDAANRALESDPVEFCGGRLRFLPSQTSSGNFTFPAVRAKLSFPRRLSKGVAIVKTDLVDVDTLREQLSEFFIGGSTVLSKISDWGADTVALIGIPRDVEERRLFDEIRKSTDRRIIMQRLLRYDAPLNNPSCGECEEAITREFSAFLPKGNHNTHQFQVEVFPPQPKDVCTKITITFDGRLHLEAAKALEHIDGKVLPGHLPWQRIECEKIFQSTILCPARVYHVIKDQLDALFFRLKKARGSLHTEFTRDGAFRVKISANATRTVAEMRHSLETLMRGRFIDDPRLTPSVLQILSVKDASILKIEEQTRTHIDFDRHCQVVRIFGAHDRVAIAEQRLIQTLLAFHERKQLDIHLRRRGVPDMKEVMKLFGPGLHILKEKVPEADFTLDIRRLIISVRGDKDTKQKAEGLISDMTKNLESDPVSGCPICFCPVEEGYHLEDCGHRFCQSCLVEQCESAIKNRDILPLRCAHEGCGAYILMTDLRALLPPERLVELFWAALGNYVTSSGGKLRFCPSPDCPSVYDMSGPNPFVCGSCFAATCTDCHLEYHPHLSCERYKKFKNDPDWSVEVWRQKKDNVKQCRFCGYLIEKLEGCNHVECRCGIHICWNCLEGFETSDLCYEHLRSIHLTIT